MSKINVTRTSRKMSGLCPDCGNKPEYPLVHCRACLEKAKIERTSRINNGLCDRCGKPTEPGRINCRTCLDSIKTYRRRNIDAGLCPRCGKNPMREHGLSCQECHEKQHISYIIQKTEGRHTVLRRKAEGLCVRCGEKLLSDTYNGKPRATCDKCRLEQRKKAAIKGNYRYPHILERDNFTCQICGRQRRLHIHHIDGNGMSHNGIIQSRKDRNDSPDNLITLCNYCHYSITCLRQGKEHVELTIKLLRA